jgi:hypothetical protein
VKTSSFRTYTGPGRVSIARYAPRRHPAGYRVYAKLAPGPWFNSVGVDEYCHLYGAILANLDPKQVYAELVALMAPEEPVLLCWEVPPFTAPQPIPAAGLEQIGRSNWCHRRMVAVWFKERRSALTCPSLSYRADAAKPCLRQVLGVIGWT